MCFTTMSLLTFSGTLPEHLEAAVAGADEGLDAQLLELVHVPLGDLCEVRAEQVVGSAAAELVHHGVIDAEPLEQLPRRGGGLAGPSRSSRSLRSKQSGPCAPSRRHLCGRGLVAVDVAGGFYVLQDGRVRGHQLPVGGQVLFARPRVWAVS